MNNILLKSLGYFVIFICLVGLSLALCVPFSWCWNYVMPDIFGLQTIDWKQAFCLIFIFQYLFKDVSSKS